MMVEYRPFGKPMDSVWFVSDSVATLLLRKSTRFHDKQGG